MYNTRCQGCMIKLTVENPTEYTCMYCGKKVRKKRDGEYTIKDLCAEFHVEYKRIKRMIQNDIITPVYLTNGMQTPVFDKKNYDIIKKHIEEYRRQI